MGHLILDFSIAVTTWSRAGLPIFDANMGSIRNFSYTGIYNIFFKMLVVSDIPMTPRQDAV